MTFAYFAEANSRGTSPPSLSLQQLPSALLLKNFFFCLNEVVNEKHLKLLTNFGHSSDSAKTLLSVEQIFMRKMTDSTVGPVQPGRVEAKQH